MAKKAKKTTKKSFRIVVEEYLETSQIGIVIVMAKNEADAKNIALKQLTRREIVPEAVTDKVTRIKYDIGSVEEVDSF